MGGHTGGLDNVFGSSVFGRPIESLRPCISMSQNPSGSGKAYCNNARGASASGITEYLDADELTLLCDTILRSADGASTMGTVSCRHQSVNFSPEKCKRYVPFLSVSEDPGTAL